MTISIFHKIPSVGDGQAAGQRPPSHAAAATAGHQRTNPAAQRGARLRLPGGHVPPRRGQLMWKGRQQDHGVWDVKIFLLLSGRRGFSSALKEVFWFGAALDGAGPGSATASPLCWTLG